MNTREKLFEKYENLIETDSRLNRTLVSFQANKQKPFYRWFKYKEGFSSELVKYFIEKYHPEPGKILDPFAGIGTTLFSARDFKGSLFSEKNSGWRSTGIEVMPVGKFVIKARIASERIDKEAFHQEVRRFWDTFENFKCDTKRIQHIPITRNAFPDETENKLNRYFNYCDAISDKDIRTLFKFAAFCILEEISFTRKDGQYLRWDYRANRTLKAKFDKGKIYAFEEAVSSKFRQIIGDLQFIGKSETLSEKEPEIIIGSSLKTLPELPDQSFDFVMTSPPYCNRYDYTRTYALELVFLGHTDAEVKHLRQEMLSCTVENKEKKEEIKGVYRERDTSDHYEKVMAVYESCDAMQEVNGVLEKLNSQKKLNNSNIPRMVRNYFLEMCFIIFEMQRILKPGGFVIMVNDNIRYGGEEVPADLILSSFAECFGLAVRKIWTLPRGKGNSSQQMGNHGRTELRKCVYVWEKRDIGETQLAMKLKNWYKGC